MFTRRAAAAATSRRRPRSSAGWLFPVGDEVSRARLRRHVQRHVPGDRRGSRAAGDVLRRLRRQRDHGRGLPVGEGARLGAGRRSSGAAARRRGSRRAPETFEGQVVIKREILPDGRHKLILKDPATRRLHATGSSPAADGRVEPRRAAAELRRRGRPDGSPASIQRPIDSREKSWSTTIDDAPMTPASPPSDERWIEQVAGRQRQRPPVDRLADRREEHGPGCWRRRRR